jgi:hypothetical protein
MSGALKCADMAISKSAMAQMANGTPNTRYFDAKDFGSETRM